MEWLRLVVPVVAASDRFVTATTYVGVVALMVLEVDQLRILRRHVAFTSSSPSLHAFFSYLLLLAYLSTLGQLVNAARAAHLGEEQAVLEVYVALKLVGAVLRAAYGAGGSFARVALWLMALNLDLSAQLFAVAAVDCARSVLMLVVSSAGAPRFLNVPLFLSGVQYAFALVDRVLLWHCWTSGLPYPAVLVLPVLGDWRQALVITPAVLWLGSSAIAPAAVATLLWDAYARDDAPAVHPDASAELVGDRQAQLVAVARKHFPSFSLTEVTELVQLFVRLDVDANNAVDARELSLALGKHLGSSSEFDVRAAQKLIDEVDVDQSGTLDFFEFLRCISAAQESHLGRLLAQSGWLSFLRPIRAEESDDVSTDSLGLPRCVSCLERERCVLFEPCMHVPLCRKCARVFARNTAALSCPICKARVDKTRRIYL